ncbi:peptide chain release factor N(5)-glutamine methyltransferase [Oceanospirillum sp.]|uniref:peptide chain release factor N(5)-glutamine methyltransferase n=1 Tax=Oceanospirillum sp. TaxID=2021254 RepID=UPI003A944C8D
MLPDVQTALDWAVEALAASDTARLDSECLLADCVRQSRTWLFTWPDKILKDEQWRRFEQLVERRKTGEPVAYLLGYREFWGLTLKVSPDTLIPRPDTEDLVAKVLELMPQAEAKVADLGTGTGAIALALASERPNWQITACDFNPGAVTLAEVNRKTLGFEQVTVLQSDWCQALETDAVASGGFDLIASNPPYIEDDDPHLSQGDVRFEPLSALTSGSDGLDDIRLITQQAAGCLRPGGWLIFEHGYNQASAVRGILSAAGYQNAQTALDLAGVDRMSFAQRP